VTVPFPPGASIVAYLRDSGGEEQDLSVSQQEDALREWALENNLVITHFYKDMAQSGGSVVGREQLHSLMNTFRHGCPERGVVVWKYNRFARNIDNAQFYRAEIRSRGYIFYSLNDEIPDGPAGRIFEALIDYKDEQYLIDLSIDVKRGLRDLVKTHGCVPGIPPRGFKREPVTIGQRRNGSAHVAHRWVPDPETASLVLKAFEMRASGASLGQIQTETNLYGGVNSYRTFFSNKLYIGILEFSELVIDDYCEPIVPTQLWEAVQEKQRHYRGHHHVRAGSPDHPRRKNSKFLLSGLARCARCGSPLYGHSSHQRNGTTYDSYFCTRAYRKRDCVRHRIPRQIFEDAVLSTLTDHILQLKVMEAARITLVAQQSGRLAEQEQKKRQLKRRLSKVSREIGNLSKAIAVSGHSTALLELLSESETFKTQLLTSLGELNTSALQPVPEINEKDLQANVLEIKRLIQDGDPEKLRTILRGYVDHVDVDRDGNELFGVIFYFYPPSVPISGLPSGPPQYRHSIQFPFAVPALKKSRS